MRKGYPFSRERKEGKHAPSERTKEGGQPMGALSVRKPLKLREKFEPKRGGKEIFFLSECERDAVRGLEKKNTFWGKITVFVGEKEGNNG